MTDSVARVETFLVAPRRSGVGRECVSGFVQRMLGE